MSTESTNWETEKEKLILQRNRNKIQFSTTLQWLELLEDGTNLLPYFREHDCRRIAVYGAAEIGGILLKEIEKDNLMEVSYFLDKNAEKQREKCGKSVYLPEEFAKLPEVDMVVVTAITFFESVFDTLMCIRPEIPVVSLKKILEVRKDEVWYEQR